MSYGSSDTSLQGLRQPKVALDFRLMKLRNVFYTLILGLLIVLSACAGGMHKQLSTDENSRSVESYADDAMEQKEAPRGERETNKKTEVEDSSSVVRMLVYEANQQIQVQELDSSVARVKNLIKSSGGYIENQSLERQPARARFRLRIPVKSFHDVLRKLAGLGQVLRQNVRAQDITREFSDLSQRLENRTRLRTRLYQILKKTKETKQRIRILNEIARLDKEIDSMAARRKFLARKAAFSTIDLELLAEKKLAVHRGSAIGWIRSLRPEKRTLSGKIEFSIPLPAGFIDNKESYSAESGDAIYFSPGGVKVRIASIANNPLGDAAFYARAILYERQRYSEKMISTQTTGNRFSFSTPQQVGYQKAYYQFVLMLDGDRLHIVEVYYPDLKQYEKHKKAVAQALQEMQPSSFIERIFEAIW